MAEEFFVGQDVRLKASFRETVGNALVDPATVTLRVREPSGTVNVYDDEVVRDSTGLYHFDYPTSVAGRYTFRFEGSSPGQGVDEGAFRVIASSVL